MPTLTFQVDNQRIRRTDNYYVVADSRNYLYARFSFTPDWDGVIKTAIFRNQCSGVVKNVILENDMCLVPWEVLEQGDASIEVSVFGGDRITANTARFFNHMSGYSEDGSAPDDPTPDVYTQIINRMADVETAVEAAQEAAENAATRAETARDDAETEAGRAITAADVATESADEAESSATAAGNSATQAASSAVAAEQAKDEAVSAKTAAESARDEIMSVAQDIADIRSILEGMREVIISMTDTAGNESMVTVFGKEE